MQARAVHKPASTGYCPCKSLTGARRQTLARSGESDGPDIDKLAQQLSAAAASKSSDNQDDPGSFRSLDGYVCSTIQSALAHLPPSHRSSPESWTSSTLPYIELVNAYVVPERSIMRQLVTRFCGAAEIWQDNLRAAEAQSRMPPSTAQQKLMDVIGGGGFSYLNFTVKQYLGSLNVDLQSSTGLGASEALFMGARSDRPKSPAFLMHNGYFTVNYPEPATQTVLLREYLPSTLGLGVNDACICHKLDPLPAGDIQSKIAEAKNTQSSVGGAQPFTRLLGYYWGPQSERGELLDPEPEAGDVLWLVYRPINYRPLALYPLQQQEQPMMQRLLLRLPGVTPPTAPPRHTMLRRIIWQTVYSLLACHLSNVAHGQVSTASFVASTWQDSEIAKQLVRLDVFAFANAFEGQSQEERMVSAQRADSRALGLTVLEIVFSSLSSKGPGDETRMPAWRRLTLDVFGGDVLELRQYCTGVEEWREAVEFMDGKGRGGWDVVGRLLAAASPLQGLLQHPFLAT